MTAAKPPERVTLTLGAYPDPTPVEYVRADAVEKRERALLDELEVYLTHDEVDVCCKATVRDIILFIAALAASGEKL